MGERYRRIEELVALVTLLVFLQDSNKKEGTINMTMTSTDPDMKNMIYGAVDPMRFVQLQKK